MRLFRVGQEVGVDNIGKAEIDSITGDEVALKVKVRRAGYGPMGRSGIATERYVVRMNELMTVEEYEYGCWKGTVGPGARLREMVKGSRGEYEK